MNFSAFIALVALLSALISANADMIQEKPIRVNKNIKIIGTAFESARDGKKVVIEAPSPTQHGDFLIMFLGGSASGKKIPNGPDRDWNPITSEGKEDLNLRAYWKVAGMGDLMRPFFEIGPNIEDNVFSRAVNTSASLPQTYDDTIGADEWTIGGGKNTFVSIVAISGMDHSDPIVDADAEEDTEDGREGEAEAPSVRTEKDSVVLACFVYDDPHVAEVTTRGFEMLLSVDTGTGDGMAIAFSETDGDKTGSIKAMGSSYEKGGSDDIAMTVSFRARYETDAPTLEPTEMPATTTSSDSDDSDDSSLRRCITEKQKNCREGCFERRKCSDDDKECRSCCRDQCCA